jgi:hypothetical protein
MKKRLTKRMVSITSMTTRASPVGSLLSRLVIRRLSTGRSPKLRLPRLPMPSHELSLPSHQYYSLAAVFSQQGGQCQIFTEACIRETNAVPHTAAQVGRRIFGA